MKRCAKISLLFSALLFGLCIVAVGRVKAQTVRTLHTFDMYESEGIFPSTGLVLSDNVLYGTAADGGVWNNGTVFSLNKDGTGFSRLYSFTGGNDGASPVAGCVLSDNTLYGTAQNGGILNNGTAFSLNTDGTGFTNLHSFVLGYFLNPGEGGGPTSLVISSNTLYGTLVGWSSGGTVYKLSIDGTGFTNLYGFTEASTNSSGFYTNSDGAGPNSLVLSGNKLYGTAGFGGASGLGTVFAVNTDGSGFTVLHSFAAGSSSRSNLTNSDGAYPNSLVLSANTLYGTTPFGGSSGNGTVFAVNTDGSGFTVLHSFTPGSGSLSSLTNSDGSYPAGKLALSRNTLYGAAADGGPFGNGTVFCLNTNGMGFTVLYTFTHGKAGAHPLGVILSDNTLYGAANEGGSPPSGLGTVFSLSFPPQPRITRSMGQVILAWPTNYAGFDYSAYNLESTSNLGPSAIWTTNLPEPVIVNGQYTVTNPVSGTLQFFRLAQ